MLHTVAWLFLAASEHWLTSLYWFLSFFLDVFKFKYCIYVTTNPPLTLFLCIVSFACYIKCWLAVNSLFLLTCTDDLSNLSSVMRPDEHRLVISWLWNTHTSTQTGTHTERERGAGWSEGKWYEALLVSFVTTLVTSGPYYLHSWPPHPIFASSSTKQKRAVASQW